MKCFFAPYEGEKPYIFFSFCQKDERVSYGIIDRLCVDGYRVWYDDGIHPGSDWLEIIAEHLEKSAVCIAAISANSADSVNCRNEMTYAINAQKPLVPVILESFAMSKGLMLQICSTKFIKYYEYAGNEDAFFSQLEKAECLVPCHSGKAPTAEELDAWKKRTEAYLGAAAENVPGSEIDRIGREADEKVAQILKKQKIRHSEAERAAASLRRDEEKRSAEEIKAAEELKRRIEDARKTIAEAEKSYADILRDQAERRAKAEKEEKAISEKETQLDKDDSRAIAAIRKEAEAMIRELRSAERARETIRTAQEKADALLATAREKVARILTGTSSSGSGISSGAAQEASGIVRNAVAEIGPVETPSGVLTPEQAQVIAEAIVAAASAAAALAGKKAMERIAIPRALLVRLSSGRSFRIYDGETAIRLDPFDGFGECCAYIICGPGGLHIKKAASDSPVLHRGKEIHSRLAELDAFDMITLGREEFVILSEDGADDLPRLRAGSSLSFLAAVDTGELRRLDRDPVYLDRNHAGEWGGDVLKSSRVSRREMAKIVSDAEGFRFENIPRDTAKNRCFLNGKEILPSCSQTLSDGDLIDIAGCDRFVFRTLRLT